MAGIASLAKSKRFKVTGGDQNVYPPMSTQLEREGIEIIEGFNPSQVELNPDIYIVGNIVKRGNPLMETILNEGFVFQSGPQWLYENILHKKWVIAIAGTHGKTTTTSLLAAIFAKTKLDPTIINGGVINSINNSAKLGKSDWSILEADESDGSFVHIPPTYSIITNIDREHMDYYLSLIHI